MGQGVEVLRREGGLIAGTTVVLPECRSSVANNGLTIHYIGSTMLPR